VNTKIPFGYHIIDERAFPISAALLRHINGTISRENRIYNTLVSKQRGKIENIFGMFKNKFARCREL
jgi:hypothetical protein